MLESFVTNFFSAPVLAFALGILAAAIRSDLKVPEPVTQAISIYLLLAIGLKGGVALRGVPLGDVAAPAALAVLLGILVPAAAYGLLRLITRLNRDDRGSMAAHYGSTSLVTFTAALVFLADSGIEVPAYAATMLAILEVPGILVGIVLARRHLARTAGWGATFHEVLAGKSVVLLLGGLGIGAVLGEEGFAPISVVFADGFRGVLVLFLLALGTEVGQRLRTFHHAGPGIYAFALGFPPLVGLIGVAAGTLGGLGVGGSAILGVLVASASYIAAPAAVRIALPQANLSLALTASIGLTFPLNLTLGIPLLTWFAQTLGA